MRPNARSPIIVAETALVAGWQQLTSTDQASNAISDPGAYCDGTTGFNGDLFTWQTIDVGVPIIDGARENCPGWTRNLRELIPDFDPAIDIIDLRADIVACPMNTAQYGFMIAIADDLIANRATWNAAGSWAKPGSATVWNGGQVGATGGLTTSGTIGTNTNPCTQLYSRQFWTTETSPSSRVHAQVSRSGLDEAPLTMQGATGPTMATDPSLWRIFVALTHWAAVDATDNVVSLRVYWKRIRGGSSLT